MISSIDVNCEKMIVFSSSSRSWMSRSSSKVLRILADEGGSSDVADFVRALFMSPSQLLQHDSSLPLFNEVILTCQWSMSVMYQRGEVDRTLTAFDTECTAWRWQARARP